ncbi:uncharacterized protein LY79DRAFT_181558 [Colletotrichum navitas]|uniref:Uncharacterized protein n=1 Tax=Colletotrichum navitas TaxID=681940 RepID=A0AAD8PZZ0_9PEZI|nr:uncharacterized protein LY79DRAFT_181558 [Colletotrichum navitas]KAK1593250.1 hypothetical protein LY79DRAFT_181558 [Colletotrichum navitas]
MPTSPPLHVPLHHPRSIVHTDTHSLSLSHTTHIFLDPKRRRQILKQVILCQSIASKTNSPRPLLCFRFVSFKAPFATAPPSYHQPRSRPWGSKQRPIRIPCSCIGRRHLVGRPSHDDPSKKKAINKWLECFSRPFPEHLSRPKPAIWIIDNEKLDTNEAE